MPRELAIVLATGSIQSAVTCALAAQKHRIVMLFAETGLSAGRPGQSFDALVQHFKPYRSHRLPMSFLATAGSAVREGREGTPNVDPRATIDASARIAELVPVIGVGLRFAMQYSAVAMYLGTRVGAGGDRDADSAVSTADVARWTEFGQLWGEMAQVTCDQPTLEIGMPLLELEPWQVVDLGIQVGAPLHLTWSCDNHNGDPCGGCRGCREREVAFQRTGRPDPAKPSQRSNAER